MMERFIQLRDKIVLCFDLDDTLYNERDYVISGLRFVGRSLEGLYGASGAVEFLIESFETNLPDPIGVLCSQLGLSASVKTSLVSAMRAHAPEIKMLPEAKELIEFLKANALPFAIITDGRSVTQRRKLQALGLLEAPFLSISEECGLAKTDPERFLQVERVFDCRAYAYIGDNPSKDFRAPNLLGWETVMVKTAGHGIHPQDLPSDSNYHPKLTVADLGALPWIALAR